MKEQPAVVFDLGKVLVDFDYRISAAKIARQSRFTPAQVRELLDHSPLLFRLETGLLTGEQFYGSVLSFEQGAMKPDPKIYAVVERMAGRSGQDIVYLDDRAENVAAGLARGWRTLLHQTPEQSIAALRQWGLPVDLSP